MKLRKKAMKPIPGKLKNRAEAIKEAPKKATRKAAIKVPKLPVPKEPFKQGEFFKVLAEQTNLSTKEVKGVLEAIKEIAKVHLVKTGPGKFTLPGLCRLSSVSKPATKTRKGRHPLTGEEMMFKAKPARKIIKIKILKKFKSELK